jgi:hypothetical protein
MMIKLSRTHVDFRFADSLEFTVAEELTIANPGNSRAEFKCVPSVPPLALVPWQAMPYAAKPPMTASSVLSGWRLGGALQ